MPCYRFTVTFDHIDIDDEVRPVGAVLLLVTAAAHLFLAHEYTGVVVGSGRFNGNGISQAFLFYATGALLLGLSAALGFGNPRLRAFAWSVGGFVTGVVLAALLVYRFGSPGEIGPIPDMSNSSWLPVGKPVSALADAAFIIIALGRRPAQRRRDRSG